MEHYPKSIKPHPRQGFWEGAAAAWPICLGYVPIGAAFGVLAEKAGLSPVEIGLMSGIVFAGSSQFIAVSMLSSGASPFAVIATTFMVNLRHLLMSSALAVFLRKTSRKKLTFFAYGITDESFAVNYVRFKEGDWGMVQGFGVNQAPNVTWIFSTVLGGVFGRFIPEKAFGMDYALPAMFICLLVFQVRGRVYLITAIIAGISATGFAMIIPGNAYIILASIFAATIGVILKKRNSGGHD